MLRVWFQRTQGCPTSATLDREAPATRPGFRNIGGNSGELRRMSSTKKSFYKWNKDDVIFVKLLPFEIITCFLYFYP